MEPTPDVRISPLGRFGICVSLRVHETLPSDFLCFAPAFPGGRAGASGAAYSVFRVGGFPDDRLDSQPEAGPADLARIRPANRPAFQYQRAGKDDFSHSSAPDGIAE